MLLTRTIKDSLSNGRMLYKYAYNSALIANGPEYSTIAVVMMAAGVGLCLGSASRLPNSKNGLARVGLTYVTPVQPLRIGTCMR